MIHLRGLEQTADLHRTSPLGGLRVAHSLLSLLRIQISIVARELLERDQEVTQVGLEFVQVISVCEQANDKLLDLSPV